MADKVAIASTYVNRLVDTLPTDGRLPECQHAAMANFLREWRLYRDMTLEQVGDAVGTDKTQISKLESGSRRLTIEWLRRLASAYQVDPETLMRAPGAPAPARSELDFARAMPITDGPRDLPVYGSVKGSPDGELVDLGHPVDWTHRPPSLIGITEGGALYVTGTSMEPRYEHGEMVIYHPGRPIRRGCYVVIEFDDHTGVVKRWLRGDDRQIEVEQLNPAKKLNYPRARVLHVWRIIRGGEE